MSTDRSGPAFPADEYYDEKRIGQSRGMTLRDWFAGQAVAGLLAHHGSPGSELMMAAIAYNVADAMIARKEVRT